MSGQDTPEVCPGFVIREFSTFGMYNTIDLILCGKLVHTFVRCLGELKEDYKKILRQLECQPSIRGGTEAHHKINSSNVGASETLAESIGTIPFCS